MHGWSTSAFSDGPAFAALEWQTEIVPVSGLTRFLLERQHLGFSLGRDDLFLSQEGLWELLFCHEGDLHLRTADHAFAAQLAERLRAAGVALVLRSDR